jgi:hypothetical protein
MIIMGKKKQGSVAAILEKLNESKFDKMKHENSQMSHAVMDDDSMESATKSLMSAIESKDSKAFQESLKSIIQMYMKE